MKAKKSYGQHFLIKESISRYIVDLALSHSESLPILEIGPGKGALTKYLHKSGKEFKAYDADPEMIDFLTQRIAHEKQLFFHQNCLKADLATTFDFREYMVLGNFPFNISSQILIKILEYVDFIPKVIGMFQKELAERIVSPPGNRVYGKLSVLVQAFYSAKIECEVAPDSFVPQPKVRSAVILLNRIRHSLSCDEKKFKTVVRLAFGQRRKMLKNTLAPIIVNKDLVSEDIFKKRPEHLSAQDFENLTTLIFNNTK